MIGTIKKIKHVRIKIINKNTTITAKIRGKRQRTNQSAIGLNKYASKIPTTNGVKIGAKR